MVTSLSHLLEYGFLTFMTSYFPFFVCFVLLLYSSPAVANATPSLACVILLSLLMYLFFQPTSTLHASGTICGKRSFRNTRSFSIWFISFPYFCLSDMYMNIISWCSSYSFSSTFFVSLIWLCYTSCLNTALASSLNLPKLSPNSLHFPYFKLLVFRILISWVFLDVGS